MRKVMTGTHNQIRYSSRVFHPLMSAPRIPTTISALKGWKKIPRVQRITWAVRHQRKRGRRRSAPRSRDDDKVEQFSTQANTPTEYRKPEKSPRQPGS